MRRGVRRGGWHRRDDGIRRDSRRGVGKSWLAARRAGESARRGLGRSDGTSRRARGRWGSAGKGSSVKTCGAAARLDGSDADLHGVDSICRGGGRRRDAGCHRERSREEMHRRLEQRGQAQSRGGSSIRIGTRGVDGRCRAVRSRAAATRGVGRQEQGGSDLDWRGKSRCGALRRRGTSGWRGRQRRARAWLVVSRRHAPESGGER
jgi:hypothetical protein